MKSKGFGFVRFSDESEQQRALIEMQHMTGLGRRPIKVSLASIKKYDCFYLFFPRVFSAAIDFFYVAL